MLSHLEPPRGPALRTLITNYRNHPGEHCGSVAMRGLLEHYCGLELPEPAVFGLGAGLDCLYLSGPAMDPAFGVFGRTGTLEVDVAANLGVDYREQPEADDDRAWELVRAEVQAGRPTMLSGDILYLDYREFKVHFPAHRFVLLGFDDEREIVWIADRIREEAEECSYGAVRASRNPPEGISTHNLWGRFHDTAVGRSLTDAGRLAVGRCARRMLGKDGATELSFADGDTRVLGGIAAIRAVAEELPAWREREDAAWIASFNSRCIEKFGNGGGNFRRLYAGFLEWLRELDPGRIPEAAPGLARRAADGWTAAAAELEAAAADSADAAPWHRAAARLAEVASCEEQLFARLLDAAG